MYWRVSVGVEGKTGGTVDRLVFIHFFSHDNSFTDVLKVTLYTLQATLKMCILTNINFQVLVDVFPYC